MSLACYRWVGFEGRATPALERVFSASAPQDRFCGPRDPSIHQLSALESPMQPKGGANVKSAPVWQFHGGQSMPIKLRSNSDRRDCARVAGLSTCPAPSLCGKGQGPNRHRCPQRQPQDATSTVADKLCVTEGCAAQAAAAAGGGGPAARYGGGRGVILRAGAPPAAVTIAVAPWSHSKTCHAAIASPRPRAANILVVTQTGRSVRGFQVKRGVQQDG